MRVTLAYAANKLKRQKHEDPILGSMTRQLEVVASPWQAREEQDAAWLQQRTFQPRSLVEPDWTAIEERTLKRAFMDLASGKLQKPTETMKTAHFLSHHVMEGRHSQRSCCRKLRQLRRELGSTASWEAVADESDASSSDGDASSSDSDDEVMLTQPLGL